jgi:RimJ/RimL family protein N-acetyltransferase
MKLVNKQPVIRQATLDDVPAIRAFHAASWLNTYPNDEAGVSKAWVREQWRDWDSSERLEESRNYVRSFLADPEQLYRIASVDKRVVALLHASRHTGKQELRALYIDKDYQGTGLAQQLFGLADAFWDPHQPVELAVVDYNSRAKRFYEKQGFKKIEGSEYRHADTMPSIRMVRETNK